MVKMPDDLKNVYKLIRPTAEAEIPLMFDSPHSGKNYPGDFAHACPRGALERAEDNDVDALFADAPQSGATLLCALFPRTYIDANRAENDIDTELLSQRWPGPLSPTPRTYAGIGLIRRLVKPGMPVYDRTLTIAEIQSRLETYYRPYHRVLKATLDDAHYRYGSVWHIDCHSMPSVPVPTMRGVESLQPDFVIGDRDGTTCDAEFTHLVRDALKDMGYKVSVNHPYKGVEILRRYSKPSAGRHSLQLEINKALYWNETTNVRNSNFDRLKSDLGILIEAVADFTRSQLVDLAAD